MSGQIHAVLSWFGAVCIAAGALIMGPLAEASAQPASPALAAAAPDLVATPGRLNFSAVQYGKTKTITVSLGMEVVRDDYRYEITSMDIKGAAAANYSAARPPWYPNLPYPKGDLQVAFSPGAVATYAASLEITYRSSTAGPPRTLIIPLSGQGACVEAMADCDPPAPLCRVDANTESHVLWAVTNYTSNVAPLINEHNDVHGSRRGRGYQMPLNFMWQVIGFGDVFDQPNIDCCHRNVDFTRDISMKRRAQFEWNGFPFDLNSKPLPGFPDTTIAIHVPGRLAGMTYVFPGTSEFHYFKDAAPELYIRWNGKDIFQGVLSCTNTSMSYATVRRYDPGTDVPDLNMLIQPK